MNFNLFPFLNNPTTLSALKSEFPSYRAAIEDIDPDIDIIQWWKNHEKDLANRASTFKAIILVQPSSAVASFHYFKVHLHTNRTIR